MKRLYPLLFISVLIYWGCEEKLREPVGNDFKVLNIEMVERDFREMYKTDILYKGEVNPKSLVSFVRKVHNQYDDIKMNVWLSEKSYEKMKNGVYDGSKDSNNVIYSEKSFSSKSNYIEWVQIYGDFSHLYNKRVSLKKRRPSKSIDKNDIKEIVKVDEKYGITKGKEELYVTTNYDCRLLPDPDSNVEILRIPKNTKLKVIESRDVQQGRMLNTWYKVKYKYKFGWTSGWNMKEEPELRITSKEEMLKNYENKIGGKPINNPLTGKIPEVDNWLKKNKNNYKTIKYRQWYEPYVVNNKWVCRVQYDEQIGEITISNDMLFYIVLREVVDVKDKNN